MLHPVIVTVSELTSKAGCQSLDVQSLTLQTDSANASIKTYKSLQFKGHLGLQKTAQCRRAQGPPFPVEST